MGSPLRRLPFGRQRVKTPAAGLGFAMNSRARRTPCSGGHPGPPACQPAGFFVFEARRQGLRAARRDHRRRNPHHGLEEHPVTGAGSYEVREIGGNWRSRFCTEVAETESAFTVNIPSML